MKIIAVIPARGGSKGIKNKNLKILKKKPLIYWSIKSAKESKLIEDFFVTTENLRIKKVALKYGSKVIDRPKALSKDKSKTIEVIKHAIKITKADVVVCMQPTSPKRPKGIVDLCINRYLEKKVDTLATGRIIHNFEWGKYNNLSRQNLKGWFWDDGSIYILKSQDILNNRWVGKKTYEYNLEKKYNLLEIDDFEDFNIIDKTFNF